MGEAGEGATQTEKEVPLILNLPRYADQRSVLGALTSYQAIQGKNGTGDMSPRGEIAKNLFSRIMQHIDDLDQTEDRPFSLDMKSRDEQDVLKSALFFKIHHDTTAAVNGHLRESDMPQLQALRGYFEKLSSHLGDRLSETEKLSIGLAGDISDERLKAILASDEPADKSLKDYAQYFLSQRKETH